MGVKNKGLQEKKIVASVKRCKNICNVCHKQKNRIDKSTQCQSCGSPTHRTCAVLKLAEIHQLVRGKFFGHWECVTCLKEKFPLNSLDNREIVQEGFNSNFDSKCQNASSYSIGQEEFVFKYQSGDTIRQKQYSSVIDKSDNMIENFSLQPNFKHYQNHDLHKLSKGLKGSKIFSLLHTNVCSLRGNFESMQNLINNLDHSFSVISVSEAWTQE